MGRAWWAGAGGFGAAPVRAEIMSGEHSLGDIPAQTFRHHLHELADRIADYRATHRRLPISSSITPGAIINSLPEAAPEKGEDFSKTWRCFREAIFPGIVHWGHPQFIGYFGSTTTAPAMLAEIIAAALNVNAMTWQHLTRGDGTGNRRVEVATPMAGFTTNL